MEIVAIVTLVIAVLTQFGGLVWFAARLSTELRHHGEQMTSMGRQLGTSLGKLDETVGTLDEAVAGIHTRVAIIEDRLGRFGPKV